MNLGYTSTTTTVELPVSTGQRWRTACWVLTDVAILCVDS